MNRVLVLKHRSFAVGEKFRKREAKEQILLANSVSDFVCKRALFLSLFSPPVFHIFVSLYFRISFKKTFSLFSPFSSLSNLCFFSVWSRQ